MWIDHYELYTSRFVRAEISSAHCCSILSISAYLSWLIRVLCTKRYREIEMNPTCFFFLFFLTRIQWEFSFTFVLLTRYHYHQHTTTISPPPPPPQPMPFSNGEVFFSPSTTSEFVAQLNVYNLCYISIVGHCSCRFYLLQQRQQGASYCHCCCWFLLTTAIKLCRLHTHTHIENIFLFLLGELVFQRFEIERKRKLMFHFLILRSNKLQK